MRCSCHESEYISLRLARLGHRLSVPWWSEDRTGRLSHGLEIELENMDSHGKLERGLVHLRWSLVQWG